MLTIYGQHSSPILHKKVGAYLHQQRVDREIAESLAKLASPESDRDLELFLEWKQTGSRQVLNQLFDRLDDVIERNVARWKYSAVPEGALWAEAERLVMEGLDHFDPDRGVPLRAYLHDSWLQKLYSYQASAGTLVKIPENRYRNLTRFKNVQKNLTRRLQREPNAEELADAMRLPKAEIERFRKEDFSTKIFNPDVAKMEDLIITDTTPSFALQAVYYDLDNEEKAIFEHLYGRYGREKLESTSDIAASLGVSASTVYKKKASIREKLEKYL